MAVTITVPDHNDSFSRIVLDSAEYLLRFTWNEHGGYWNFGVYQTDETPIVTSMKVLPNAPLSIWHQNPLMPRGEFGAVTDLEHIGRQDFLNGKAEFVYIPYSELLEGESQ